MTGALTGVSICEALPEPALGVVADAAGELGRAHRRVDGEGIAAGSTWNRPATQVDITPTWLALAGVSQPAQMDGKSLVPLLVDADAAALPESVRASLARAPSRADYAAGWRSAAFIEYYFVDPNVKCTAGCDPAAIAKGGGYPHKDMWCTDLTDHPNQHCWALYGCNQSCYATESDANNFIGLRSMAGSEFGNTLFAEFQTGTQSSKTDINFASPDFREYYELDTDPWELDNKFDGLAQARKDALRAELHRWMDCAGASCP